MPSSETKHRRKKKGAFPLRCFGCAPMIFFLIIFHLFGKIVFGLAASKVFEVRREGNSPHLRGTARIPV